METMNFKMIELPYVKRELSMFILLPDDIKDNTTGLEQVRKHATTILYYCSVIKKKKRAGWQLYLPFWGHAVMLFDLLH